MPRLLPTGPDQTFDSRVEEIVRRVVRAEAARLVGPAPAEAAAQESGRGLGIQNIRRAVLSVSSEASSNMTVAHATSGFASLSTPLKGSLVLSGRPLLVLVQGLFAAGGGGSLRIDVSLRGVRISGLSHGLTSGYTEGTSAQGKTIFGFSRSPESGPAELEVLADATTADGTVFNVLADYVLTMTAMEL